MKAPKSSLTQQLDEAFAECERTFVPPAPCKTEAYLNARRRYHALLIKAGILRPHEAEPGWEKFRA